MGVGLFLFVVVFLQISKSALEAANCVFLSAIAMLFFTQRKYVVFFNNKKHPLYNKWFLRVINFTYKTYNYFHMRRQNGKVYL